MMMVGGCMKRIVVFDLDGTLSNGEHRLHLLPKEEDRNNDAAWAELKGSAFQLTQEQQQAVLHPKHYEIFPGVEAIEVIAASMTKEEFRGYCKGNMLKYRLRAGNKDALEQDIAKANTYLELYAKYEYLAG